jgi:hypothetical protein
MKPMKMPSLSRRHLLIISLYSLQFRNSLEAPGVEGSLAPSGRAALQPA